MRPHLPRAGNAETICGPIGICVDASKPGSRLAEIEKGGGIPISLQRIASVTGKRFSSPNRASLFALVVTTIVVAGCATDGQQQNYVGSVSSVDAVDRVAAARLGTPTSREGRSATNRSVENRSGMPPRPHDVVSLPAISSEKTVPARDAVSRHDNGPSSNTMTSSLSVGFSAANQDVAEDGVSATEKAKSPQEMIAPNGVTEEPDTEETTTQDDSAEDSDLIGSWRLMSDQPDGLALIEVVQSVHQFFPLVEAAYLERDRTSGDRLAAAGAFDTKLKAASESQPLGFYETYRNRVGIDQPLYGGGNLFGGYRIGRGSFEPWYEERQTNEGGEWKAGFLVPLIRNREIDARRAELWRAEYDRRIAEPEIRMQLIAFVRDASTAYWQWVVAAHQLDVGRAALDLAERRTDQLQRRLDEGDIGPPVLRDNDRAIAERRAKLFDRQRKLEQAAAKLSLFFRGVDTSPLVPNVDSMPAFPPVATVDRRFAAELKRAAVAGRPEVQAIDGLTERTRVDLAEACNDLKPNLDAGAIGSQDVGKPTSSKRDKSEFELEFGLYFELPVQRRKGLGKIRSARAKIGQLDAKRRFTVDKIGAEVEMALAAIDAASRRVAETSKAVKLAEELARIERRKFDLGQSDLLAVFLREQFAIEAANNLVSALGDYHISEAELTAAIGAAWPRQEPNEISER